MAVELRPVWRSDDTVDDDGVRTSLSARMEESRRAPNVQWMHGQGRVWVLGWQPSVEPPEWGRRLTGTCAYIGSARSSVTYRAWTPGWPSSCVLMGTAMTRWQTVARGGLGHTSAELPVVE